MSKRSESKQYSPIEVLVVVLVFLFALAVIVPATQMSRFEAYRIECADNLSGIGKAMLIYANDYDDELPRAGGRKSTWAPSIPNWSAHNRYSAYGLSTDGSGGKATISSCFYLLVKYAELTPRAFVCPGDAGTTEFRLANVDAGVNSLIDLWDFGREPSKHCSYAYHMPFGVYALTTSSEPSMAVAADRNPWMDYPAAAAKKYPGMFSPDGGRESVKYGNAIAHEEEGQNVLFLDCHVAFEDHSFCGIHDDNIYTYWSGGDVRIGARPALGSEPQDRIDSLLVHEPIPPVGTTIIKEPAGRGRGRRSTGYRTAVGPVGSHKVLVVPDEQVKPEDLAAIIEDMQVMSHILDERFKETRRIQGVFTDFGDFFGRDNRATEAIYLQGYGVLFSMEVNFAFSPSPKPQGQQAEQTAENVDSTWQRARQQMFSPGDSRGPGGSGSPEEYNSQMVEELKRDLITTLKHAANIRGLLPDEWIILTVIGSGRQAGGFGGGFMMGGMGGMYGGTSSGGMMGGMGAGMGSSGGGGMGGGMMGGGMGGGMMGGGMGGGMMGGGMGGGMMGGMSGPGEMDVSPATVLTIRAKKSDVDSFAQGQQDFEQFRQKVQIFTY